MLDQNEQHELLILGLGNVLCGDDGLGVAAVDLLKRSYRAPRGVEVLDGGTLGLALLAWVTSTRRLLLVDAIRGDLPAGSLVRLDGHEVAPAVRDRLSVHQVGVADLLDGMELIGRAPPTVSLLGLVPASVELMTGLTSEVETALPRLVQAVADEARKLGFPLLGREHALAAFEDEHRADPRARGEQGFVEGTLDRMSWRRASELRSGRHVELCERV